MIMITNHNFKVSIDRRILWLSKRYRVP